MEIIESDLNILYKWIKNLNELCKSQTALIESHHDVIESLEQRLNNIELLLTQEDNK